MSYMSGVNQLRKTNLVVLRTVQYSYVIWLIRLTTPCMEKILENQYYNFRQGGSIGGSVSVAQPEGGGFGGFKPLPLKIDVYFYGLIIDKKRLSWHLFKTNRRSLSDDVNGQLYGDAEKCRDCQCMCIHSQSHLLPIRFSICMNLLFRRAIKYQIRPRKTLSKIFWEEHAPTDPHINEILNPLHYKFLATPLLGLSCSEKCQTVNFSCRQHTASHNYRALDTAHYLRRRD